MTDADKAPAPPAVLVSDRNGVRTVTFNRPAKLNGWSPELMQALHESLAEAAQDDAVKACIVTGSGPYYCAGVDFAGSLKPMRPAILVESIRSQNKALFDNFLDFPKPLFVAVNGPAIGAAVTSAFLSDGIIASEKATFLTPFKALGVVPEGCSSYTYPKAFGESVARELLEGRKITAKEALELGYCKYVVPTNQVLEKAQQVAEEWVAQGRGRVIIEEGLLETLKEVNAKESIALANALLDYPFLDAMVNFSYEKSKYGPLVAFWIARATRPIWSKL